MESKELVPPKKMSQLLIGYWLVWGLFAGIIYLFVIFIITNSIESTVLKAIIEIIAQGIMAIIIWELSTFSSFKKRTISYNDVPYVMKNLIIFTIIFCVLTGVYNIASVNSFINKNIDSNYELQIGESFASHLYDEEEMAEYNKEIEKAISEAKSKAYAYVAILEIGLTAVYLAVLPLEKKEILKYVS